MEGIGDKINGIFCRGFFVFFWRVFFRLSRKIRKEKKSSLGKREGFDRRGMKKKKKRLTRETPSRKLRERGESH
jgi:hypothetical protein